MTTVRCRGPTRRGSQGNQLRLELSRRRRVLNLGSMSGFLKIASAAREANANRFARKE